ncbi:MAG: putative Fimbral protein [Candidatus Saccharibacteria bacterium]|nr:putative Fimbral protein [Candidatus Saccharibacteria bacterium]
MIYKTNRAKKGFTIIELIVVVSVIGILAAISIVSYNGSQARARNTKMAVAVEQYRDGFENYLTKNGQYPAINTANNYCLGAAVASCTTASASWVRDTTLEDALMTVMDRLPALPGGPGTNATSDANLGYIPYRGTGNPTLDGTNSAFLVYIVEGITTCPIGPVVSGASPTFSSTPPAAGRTYATGNVSVCWLALSKP